MPDRGFTTLVNAAAAHRRRLLFAGAIDVITGLVALVWPGVTVLALALVLGLLLLLAGTFSIASGARTGSAWLIGLGTISVLAAVICLIHPGAGLFAILLGCAIWFLMLGIADLGIAFGGGDGRLYFGLLGTLSVVAGVVMLSSPGVAITTVALIVGFAFLVRGAAEFALALQLRRMRHNLG
jgi:uncharacterized membrane protein HdeD (DUF308 family)